jgi:putative transposase
LRYAFIAEHQDMWPVSVLCEVLDVSRSGFYEFLPRHAKASVDAEEVALFARVKAIAAETRHRYGRRRMAKQLQDEGFPVGRAKARQLMNKAGVGVQRPRRRGPMTTDSRHGDEVAPNLLARQFDVTAPDHVWAGDITDIWTAEGWLYLSVLVDWYSRKVVGWAMHHQMDTTWVQDAWPMALGRRSPAAGFMHHSDRGSQDASHAYQAM